jgi:hypothetical protein
LVSKLASKGENMKQWWIMMFGANSTTDDDVAQVTQLANCAELHDTAVH